MFKTEGIIYTKNGYSFKIPGYKKNFDGELKWNK